MPVRTVLGDVSKDDLGVALVHEHLLADLQCWFEQPAHQSRQYLVETPVTASLRGILNSDPYHCRDNMVLNDWQMIVAELKDFSDAGGRTVVDLTTRNLGPHAVELEKIARSSGLNIIAGTGFYVKRAHPDWVADASMETLAEFMIAELTVGIDNTGVRAGIIGEIGVSSTIESDEAKVVNAAAYAHIKTGAAINIHLPIFSRVGHQVLDLLETSGADLSRVVLSHLDETNDFDYIESLGKRGAYIELDTFGSEVAWDESGEHEPSDWERLALLLRLLDAGFVDQLLLSQDVCTKMQLVQFGGVGYGHILRTILPRLRRRGVDPSTIDRLMIKNPERMLSGTTPE